MLLLCGTEKHTRNQGVQKKTQLFSKPLLKEFRDKEKNKGKYSLYPNSFPE